MVAAEPECEIFKSLSVPILIIALSTKVASWLNLAVPASDISNSTAVTSPPPSLSLPIIKISLSATKL